MFQAKRLHAYSFNYFFALLKAKRQAHNSAISEKSRRSRPEQSASASLLSDALTKLADKIRQDGLLIKQPFATDSCQLKFVAG